MKKEEIKYVAPMAKAMEINVHEIICGKNSGNEPMREVDFGDGGFTQE